MIFSIMLQIVHSMKALSYPELKSIYFESIMERGYRDYPGLSEYQRHFEAEQDFYFYLQDFLKQADSFLALWVPEGVPAAALRCEPYRDGYLIEGLETAPQQRNRGFASQLLQAVVNELRKSVCCPVYSHIAKDNGQSEKVHLKCGFRKISDMAVYIDGSADYRCNTFCYQ